MADNIAVIGECMLEVNRLSAAVQSSDTDSLPASLSYGGDTLNTAVYLARMGATVDYVTALGDDPMSGWMISQWQSEKVGCHLVQRQQDSVPGLYMIEVDEHGERSFLYWRENSPASQLFDNQEDSLRLFSLLSSFGHIYLSGISLAIYSAEVLERLFGFLASYREAEGKVYFDGNYRPKLWASKAEAAATYEKMYALTDIALPTIEDEQMVFANDRPDAIIERIHSYGVEEVALKMGSKGCLVSDGTKPELLESNKVKVVDTTSAGDSFNAGYLASRMSGDKPEQAALAGHKLASIVIQHRGAIIPLEAMP